MEMGEKKMDVRSRADEARVRRLRRVRGIGWDCPDPWAVLRRAIQ